MVYASNNDIVVMYVHLRKGQLLAVVEDLFANHDDTKLDGQFQ